MVEAASVSDLLNSLDYGKPTAEGDVLDYLRGHFSIDSGTDLLAVLEKESPSAVLAAILAALKPFSYMVQDVYRFLGEAAVHTKGHLEVHVPLENAESLNLDLRRYRLYERSLIETITDKNLNPMLLPPTGSWKQFHDMYWPPHCISAGPSKNEAVHYCTSCPAETYAGDFIELTQFYDRLDEIAERQLQAPDADRMILPGGMRWETYRGRWKDCSKRVRPNIERPSDKCVMESPGHGKILRDALEEFRNSTEAISVENLNKFLALPYWKQRWQLFEVWFVMLILQSYGLSNLKLQIDNQEWTLAVGSVATQPIATSKLRNDDMVEFYYQYQGVPPIGLFADKKDRPEVLVLHRPKDAGPRYVLAAEVKARKRYSAQDMKGALFSLMEWDPAAIAGASYYQLDTATGFAQIVVNDVQVVAANGCAPRSPVATDLFNWLTSFWRKEFGAFVSVVLIDTSGSMPAEKLKDAVSYLRQNLSNEGATDFTLATFADSTVFHPPSAIDDGSLDLEPRGATNLTNALESCQEKLQLKHDKANQLVIHVVTDLEVTADEVDQLLQLAASPDVMIRIYTWNTPTVRDFLKSYDLKDKLVLL